MFPKRNVFSVFVYVMYVMYVYVYVYMCAYVSGIQSNRSVFLMYDFKMVFQRLLKRPLGKDRSVRVFSWAMDMSLTCFPSCYSIKETFAEMRRSFYIFMVSYYHNKSRFLLR